MPLPWAARSATPTPRPSIAIRALARAWNRPQIRSARYQAFDADFDQEQLDEARRWHRSFDINRLPRGETSFARSSGPGGQHVNKTESKATTSWPIKELLSRLPKLLHSGVRASKYYTSRSDSLSIQAQTHRQRDANVDENLQKLAEEIRRIYLEAVPGESSPSKVKKHAESQKAFHEGRIKHKKLHSSKKQSRKGPVD